MTPVEGTPNVDSPMNGRLSLVTGATSGIGRAAAEEANGIADVPWFET